MSKIKKGLYPGLWLGGLFVLLLLTIGGAVSIGSVDIPFVEVWRIIAQHLLGSHEWLGAAPDGVLEAIVWQIRLPRTLLAAMVGASLASAGVVFQGILRNPLADPYILGVSSGAALGAVIAIVTGWGTLLFGGWSLPGFAFLFASLSLFIVLRLARIENQMSTGTLILSGVVVQAFLGAVLTFVISLSPEQLLEIHYWLMGSLALRDWSHAGIVLPFLVLGFPLMWACSRELNLFALGDRSAGHLGVPVEKVRFFLLVIASLITAGAVSVSGTIGFVGLVIPHIMRMLTGPDHRLLLPVSALTGAVFLVWADTIARVVMEPRELPIGVITAFVGAPFFAFLLRKQRRIY